MKHDLQQNDLFKWAVDAIELTITIDTKGVIRHIGKAYAEVLEMDQNDIVGMHIEDIIPGTRMPEVLKTGKPEYGSVFVMKNGVPIIVNRFPIRDEEGTLRGAICVTSFSDLATASKLSKQINQLRRENERYRSQLNALANSSFSIDSIIGESPPIKRIKSMVEKVADTDLTMLVTGETGTGKEVFANALHQLSSRRLGNFVKINCAAIPKELLESELFGYQEGAFSGASKGGKQGKFELANNGTILLDEIAELTPTLQSKLLRVLQEKELERVGGLKPVKLNVRVICSTNKDLEKMVEEGSFRQDLYYRINVLELYIPPLRERKEDIPLLCDYLIKKINRYHGCNTQGIDEPAMRLLNHYNWPGNVRELEHTLERACVLSPSGTLGMECFDFFLPRVFHEHEQTDAPTSLYDQKQRAERDAIVNALLQTNGNKAKAARLLGIPRSLLYDKIARYEIV